MPTTAATGSQQFEAITEERVERAIEKLRENFATLREWSDSWVEAWNAYDVDAIVALISEDIVYEDPSMFGEHIRGREQFASFVAAFFRAFPDARFSSSAWPVHFSLDGDGVAAPWRVTGTFTGDWAGGPSPLGLAPTGRSVDVEGVDLYRFRDGLLSEWTSVVNAYEIARQIGAAPGLGTLPILVRAQRVLAPLMRRLR